MQQLALFQGDHVPFSAARHAMAHGDLPEARRLLSRASGGPEAADAARLGRILSALHEARDAAAVHDAFAYALAEAGPPGGFAAHEWFAIYARSLWQSLESAPGSWFRGWLAAHFALAAHQPEQALVAAQRAVVQAPPGPCWLEAARVAYALHHDSTARNWLSRACRESPSELSALPPALQPCGIPALEAPAALPSLPASVEELWNEVAGLDLPGPRSPWVAVLGEIECELGSPELFDSDKPDADGDPPGAFLAALRAARAARARDPRRSPGRCSDRELRARRRMQQLAPALLARYLGTL